MPRETRIVHPQRFRVQSQMNPNLPEIHLGVATPTTISQPPVTSALLGPDVPLSLFVYFCRERPRKETNKYVIFHVLFSRRRARRCPDDTLRSERARHKAKRPLTKFDFRRGRTLLCPLRLDWPRGLGAGTAPPQKRGRWERAFWNVAPIHMCPTEQNKITVRLNEIRRA